jgi:translation elongation factor EF-4
VDKLLDEVIKRIPPPHHSNFDVVKTDGAQALVFDFKYDNHRGVIVYVRVVEGEFKKGELHSGKKGPVVKNPKQAIAIALSEAGMSKPQKKQDL